MNSSVFGNLQQALYDNNISHRDVASSQAGGVAGEKAEGKEAAECTAVTVTTMGIN